MHTLWWGVKEKEMSETVNALKILICETRYKSVTKTGLRRVRRAGRVLGLKPEDQIELEKYLDFRDNRTGELWPKLKGKPD